MQKLEQQMKLHLPRYDRQKREMAIERKNRTPTPTQPKKVIKIIIIIIIKIIIILIIS